jgi:hypothetical protein
VNNVFLRVVSDTFLMRCFADEKVMILSNGNSEKHSEKVTGEKSFSQSYSIILELDKGFDPMTFVLTTSNNICSNMF